MKKTILLLLAWCAAASAQASFTLRQYPEILCTATPCAITITTPYSPGGLDIGIIFAHTSNNGHISSVSGGGTWVVPGACDIKYLTSSLISCAYNLSMSATTTVNVTFSSGQTAAETEFREYTYDGGTAVAYDISSGAANLTGGASQHGQALTLTGSDDLIVQAIDDGSYTVASITTPYSNIAQASRLACADALDVASGAAPTWSLASGTGSADEIAAIAIKGTAAAAANVTGYVILN